jgi:hypothetical protein
VDLWSVAFLEAVMPTRSSTGKTRPVKRTSKKPASKLDLYARHKTEYVAGRLPALVKVGPAKYLAISGRSQPGDAAFNNAVGALYTVAFTIKMASKFAGNDYMVTKLEGQYWLNEGDPTPKPGETAIWNWQLMLRVPTFVTERTRAAAVEELVAKGKPDVVRSVKLVELTEGPCVQILHVGPYTEEHASIDKMRAFASQLGKSFSGKHHEIYVSDPRRVAPEKLRTILRQPVA